ncbi:hypothetical protein EJ05DRAFT_85292 [Pseudovirgaria hyperparasitica]|uniref:Rhodopsin domain-containing protein n=1 Tax=Pseudovirgaria hyperparasitica TaxID=470096 RepID=A0A6A6W1I6_9PEZI|nr:uncharacterized protein EJ05DRAFT_85292 [Pseudovirgaria hyperparasitica]KAF2755999.1 hypothetical protein EJ05DRAFT_85292 [Pseudovirgaria hyperparasitica]
MLAAHGLTLIYVVSIFSVLATITVSLRCYTRRCLLKRFGADDFLATIALFLYLIFSVFCILGVRFGIGEHVSQLDDEHIKRTMLVPLPSLLTLPARLNNVQIWWIAYLMYGVIITIVKVSVGLFLLRITIYRHQRYLLWHAIHVTIIAGVIFVFIVAFQCKPASFFWTRLARDSTHQGTCINPHTYVALAYWFSVICVVTDFIFAGQPIFLIFTLNLGWRDKAILFGILSMATMCVTSFLHRLQIPNATNSACFAPIVRMFHLHALTSDDFLCTSPLKTFLSLPPN